MKYCAGNQLEKVQSCLNLAEDLEVDINAVDDFGHTAAQLTSRDGHTEVIRLLAATGKVDWNIYWSIFPFRPPSCPQSRETSATAAGGLGHIDVLFSINFLVQATLHHPMYQPNRWLTSCETTAASEDYTFVLGNDSLLQTVEKCRAIISILLLKTA